MEFKMTPKDRQILQYICENFSCTICNSILLQCVTLSCGHHYCNYCMELLHTGTMQQCPQCASPIRRAQPNNSIDQQIDNLINSCSESIQKAYLSTVNSRFQKSLERKARRSELKPRYKSNNNPPGREEVNLSNCLDQIRGTLQMRQMNGRNAVETNLASRPREESSQTKCKTERQLSARPRSKPAVMDVSNMLPKSYESKKDTEIDINKVNLLFGIYEHVLNLDNEPNKEMAAGDFVRDQDIQSVGMPILEMNNFTKRSEVELETLIKETDDIIRLDGHIQKWTNRMKDALSGNNESVGMTDEKFDNNVRFVDDELWKASNELLQKLQGIQKKRNIPANNVSCPPIPKPRSHKLNVDIVSDDSDAEEYEHALEVLQESLDNSYVLLKQTHDLKTENVGYWEGNREVNVEQCTAAKICPQQEAQNHNQDNNTKESSVGVSATRTRHVDSVEESGQIYIKENIEFITKMRKYKEALMKIQNHEVVTAQEIKELVPTSMFPSEEPAGTTPGIILKCRDTITPRRLSHFSQGSRRRNHSYSARLPSSASNERRPMTGTYDVPSTQRIHQPISVVPSKQHLKQRTRTNNSLFTAR